MVTRQADVRKRRYPRFDVRGHLQHSPEKSWELSRTAEGLAITEGLSRLWCGGRYEPFSGTHVLVNPLQVLQFARENLNLVVSNRDGLFPFMEAFLYRLNCRRLIVADACLDRRLVLANGGRRGSGYETG